MKDGVIALVSPDRINLNASGSNEQGHSTSNQI
jgi:hypothetical protein